MINKFDLICFTESKIDATDVISFSGYNSISQPRKQKCRRKSGGISVYFKDYLSKHIRKLETESDYILWFELDKDFTHLEEKLIFGVVYVPPENSNFHNEDELALLESEITSFRSENKYVIITGDFNARTSQLRDYTENDEFLSEIFDFDNETIDFFSNVNKLSCLNIPKDRVSMDTHTNNNGFRLLEMCKNNNLFIINGRLGRDKLVGEYTFRRTSVLDYTIASVECIKLMKNFEIVATDAVFSDGHCFLSHSLCFQVAYENILNPSTGTIEKDN